jgi:hypothetical protein
MIDDEDHPEMRRAAAELRVVLQRFVGERLSGPTFAAMDGVIAEHCSKWRKNGVHFPELAALVIPRLRVVDLVNRELSGRALEIRIVGFARRHPSAAPQEIADAVRWAFPHYHPDDSAEWAARVRREVARRMN